MEGEINETPPQTPTPAPPEGEQSLAVPPSDEIIPAPKNPIVPAKLSEGEPVKPSREIIQKLIEKVSKI